MTENDHTHMRSVETSVYDRIIIAKQNGKTHNSFKLFQRNVYITDDSGVRCPVNPDKNYKILFFF